MWNLVVVSCIVADIVTCNLWPQHFVLFPTYEQCMQRGALKIINDKVRGVRFIDYNIICTKATIDPVLPDHGENEDDA